MQFRKKPVVIEAIQFNGIDNANECIQFANDRAITQTLLRGTRWVLCLTIPTLEGPMTADPGDWIIKGVKGEFYPCKPYIFDMTYEPVA